MPNKTSIEWATHSSNPIYAVGQAGRRGWFCTKVSPGCAHCYSERLNLGRWGNQIAYLPVNEERVHWVLNGKELAAIRQMKGPARIFIGDMTDLFHEGIPAAYLDAVFDTIEACYWLTFMVLTKRPERMRNFMRQRWPDYPNVIPQFIWLGVSVENQRMADRRIPLLLQTPAAVRFVSAEPLLGPLGIKRFFYHCTGCGYQPCTCTGLALQWLIVGGESGNAKKQEKRRLVEPCCRKGSPFPPREGQHCERYEVGECSLHDWQPKPRALEWIRSLRDQASAAGVAFHFKGWGGPTPKSGGRLLDGREWNEFPTREALC